MLRVQKGPAVQEVPGSQHPLASSSLPANHWENINGGANFMSATNPQGIMQRGHSTVSATNPSTSYPPPMPSAQAGRLAGGSLQSLAAPYATVLPVVIDHTALLPEQVAIGSQSSQPKSSTVNAAGKNPSQPTQLAQMAQFQQQTELADEWVLSDDESDCQQIAAAANLPQDAEMAQLLEMGFTPEQARKVSPRSTLQKLRSSCLYLWNVSMAQTLHYSTRS